MKSILKFFEFYNLLHFRWNLLNCILSFYLYYLLFYWLYFHFLKNLLFNNIIVDLSLLVKNIIGFSFYFLHLHLLYNIFPLFSLFFFKNIVLENCLARSSILSLHLKFLFYFPLALLSDIFYNPIIFYILIDIFDNVFAIFTLLIILFDWLVYACHGFVKKRRIFESLF